MEFQHSFNIYRGNATHNFLNNLFQNVLLAKRRTSNSFSFNILLTLLWTQNQVLSWVVEAQKIVGALFCVHFDLLCNHCCFLVFRHNELLKENPFIFLEHKSTWKVLTLSYVKQWQRNIERNCSGFLCIFIYSPRNRYFQRNNRGNR